MHIAHARSSFRSNIEKKDNIEARLCTVLNRSSTGLRNGTTRERSIGDSFPYLRTKHHYHIPSTMDTAIITPVEEQNAYLELAKTHLSEDMMSIKDFVRATCYNIDPLIIDEQWTMLNSLRSDELIVLTDQMLQRLNFCRMPNLIKKLEKLFPTTRGINNEYWGDGLNVSITLAAPDGAAKKGRGGTAKIAVPSGTAKQVDDSTAIISEHGGTAIFAVPLGTAKQVDGSTAIISGHGGTAKKCRGGHNSKQIKMTKGAYKQLLMETQTDAAKQVRQYYICLEELFVQYLLYQRAYEIVKSQVRMRLLTTENLQLSSKIDVVILQNEGLAKQNDALAKQNEGLAKQNEGLAKQLDGQNEKLDTLSKILYNESESKVLDVRSRQKKQQLVVLQNRDDPERCEVLRGQHSHVRQQLKRKQEHMEVVGEVGTYKNPINLYNRFSENARRQRDERFEVNHNKVTLKNGTTPNELLDVFQNLDEQKHSVADRVKQAL